MSPRLPALTLVLVSLLVFSACASSAKAKPEPVPSTPSPAAKPTVQAAPTKATGGPVAKSYSAPPPKVIDTAKSYTATIETNKGNLTIELFAKEAPLTVNNFVYLARDRYFDGLTFHRYVAGFVVQGGDPQGTGTGGPGYRFADEPVTRDYKAGSVAMANSGPNTNGSQFFICLADQPSLPKQYNLFGQVISGMDVVLALRVGDVMRKVTVEEK